MHGVVWWVRHDESFWWHVPLRPSRDPAHLVVPRPLAQSDGAVTARLMEPHLGGGQYRVGCRMGTPVGMHEHRWEGVQDQTTAPGCEQSRQSGTRGALSDQPPAGREGAPIQLPHHEVRDVGQEAPPELQRRACQLKILGRCGQQRGRAERLELGRAVASVLSATHTPSHTLLRLQPAGFPCRHTLAEISSHATRRHLCSPPFPHQHSLHCGVHRRRHIRAACHIGF